VQNRGLFIGGREVPGHGAPLPVRNPYNQEVLAEIATATAADVDLAIREAQHGLSVWRSTPAWKRGEVLARAATLLRERAEEYARTITLESGKPIRDARAEVQRAIQVWQFAAEAAKDITGEVVPMDAAMGGETRWGMVLRVPVGVVAAITPFNFPLNLVSHKVAPALAAGNSVVLKPASATPLTSLNLAGLLGEAGLSPSVLNVVVGGGGQVGDVLVADERVAMVTFTGSLAVGRRIHDHAGVKRVTLELGSNSPNIVFADADLDLAASALTRAAFAFAGQVCISAQRIYVQKPVYDDFLSRFVKRVESLKLGDPLDEAVDLGPMITPEEAGRVEEWIARAVEAGARVVTGGRRTGAMFMPTVLADVRPDMEIVCQEAFAPVVSVVAFETMDEAVAMANDSIYGLQAGVFTRDINTALRVAAAIEAGGVWINESSIYRQDNYPYGGVKMSGLGREGVRYAIEEMTERKFVGIRLS